MKALLFLLLLPVVSRAESDHQAWSSFKLSSGLNTFEFGVEIENRVSESGPMNSVNQIKPEFFLPLGKGRLGFIYTFASGESYKVKTENRYSIAYDIKSYASDLLELNTRFRQEFRNFADQVDLAYRFRVRNSLKLKKHLYWNVQPSLSSEWRIYEKDSAGKTVENFSHRAILNFSKSVGCYNFNLHYTHNYQKEDEQDQNTHAFGLGIKVDI